MMRKPPRRDRGGKRGGREQAKRVQAKRVHLAVVQVLVKVLEVAVGVEVQQFAVH